MKPWKRWVGYVVYWLIVIPVSASFQSGWMFLVGLWFFWTVVKFKEPKPDTTFQRIAETVETGKELLGRITLQLEYTNHCLGKLSENSSTTGQPPASNAAPLDVKH